MMDLSLALRLLSRQRTLALTVTATLALGIGSTVLMFSFVNGVLLQPLPFPGAGELVSVGESSPGWKDNPVGAYTYRVWRERSHAFAHLAVMHRTERSIEGQGEPLIVEAAHVSANFFDAIGIRPMLGQTFDHDTSGNPIVLSHRLWTRLGSDPDILGRTLRMVDRPFVVVGVMPPMAVSGSFIGLGDLWIWSGTDPARPTLDEETRPGSFRGRQVIGRLKSGVSLEAARDELAVIQRQLGTEYPAFYTNVGVTVTPLREVVVGDARPVLSVLFASAAFLLLIACANVANLLLTRSVARQKEVAIRFALGARRWHIVRLCLMESVVLSTFGGILGILIVMAAMPGWMTVIGVVGDVRQRSVDQPPRPQWYFPYSNFSWPLMTLAIRTTGDPSTLIHALREAVREIDPNLPLHRITPLEDLVADTMSGRRLAFGLLAGFAATALLLAGLGVYAAVANAVAQRSQELGIRVTLGATRGAIVRLVMRDGLLMVGVGCVAGLALGVLATRLMRRLLFGVSPADPISFVVAVLILSAIACAACYVPARKAGAVDPTMSLRS